MDHASRLRPCGIMPRRMLVQPTCARGEELGLCAQQGARQVRAQLPETSDSVGTPGALREDQRNRR